MISIVVAKGKNPTASPKNKFDSRRDDEQLIKSRL